MLGVESSRGLPLIIADDLTGATEIALALSDAGLNSLAWLWKDGGCPPDGHICSVNLDTRDMHVSNACKRLEEFLGQRPDLPLRTIFKKVDSTARRHMAAEIDICLRFPEFDAVVVALAAPDDRRHTLNEIHHVGSVPVDQTPFARDLALPTGHLPTLLTVGTGRTCFHVPMANVRQGVDAIGAAMASRPDAAKAIISMDCETRDDLRNIASAVVESPERILPIGSAAMFRELIRIVAKPLTVALSPLPILVVCGSLHPIARRQLDRLCTVSGAVAAQIGAMNDDALVGVLANAIAQGKVAVIATPESMNTGEDGQVKMTAHVAELVQRLLAQQRPAALIATGGNIASAVIGRLGASALRVLDRLSPVVPVLEIVDGPLAGLPIVTKGGGVGNDDILIDAVAALRRLADKRAHSASMRDSAGVS